MEMELYMSRDEMTRLLANAVEIGVKKGLEATGTSPKLISQNKAYRRFRRSRVQNWVGDGLIVPRPNGNGRTSTVYYDYARLLELDASDRIVIRKAYVPENDKQLKNDNRKNL
jgi:hypothetical protein